MVDENAGRRGPCEHLDAGQGLVGGTRERVEIGASVDRASTQDDLRRHVSRRAERDTFVRELRDVQVRFTLYHAKVQHLEMIVLAAQLGDEKICRLDIAVDEPVSMRLAER